MTRPFTARGRQQYACPQKEIIPGQDYPVLVEVFSDEALTDRLESKSTKMHFRAEDVAALKKLLGAPRQTVTLTDIWFRTEESQLLIAYKETGTLEVTGEKLTFVYAGGKLEIPVAAIQRLVPRRRFAIFDSNEWAVVEYQLSGKNLVAAFKPAAFTGKTPHEAIVKAISNVLPR